MSDDSQGQPRSHDVAILGAHLSTALLATILARHGVDVVLVDSAVDGDVPADETTVPYTAELCFLLGRRFDIPEIARLGMFDWLDEDLRRTSGAKATLSFLYHSPRKAHDPREAVQFTVPSEHAEWHIYRPDVERHLVDLAARHGATLIEGRPVARDVVISDDGVTVTVDDGQQLHAAYVVDGSGDESLVRKTAATTEQAPPRHRARLLSAHLHGVTPFESVVPLSRYGKDSPGPWSGGTLTHAIDGGWIEVTPFGNHREGVNSLSSVKVSLDPEQHPASDGEPAEEFAAILARYPDLRRQFARAAPTSPWRRDDAWPSAVAEGSGPRYLLFDRGFGRHDFFFGRDLTLSLELVHATAAGLLGVARSGDWAGASMARVERFQREMLAYHDRWMAAARVATRDFALFNAYLRVYLLWSVLAALTLKRARLDAEAAGDWSDVEDFSSGAFWFPTVGGLPRLLESVLGDIEAAGDGRIEPDRAATSIFARLRKERFVPPLYRFWDPDARYYRFTFPRRLRMLQWVATTAPREFRRLLTKDNITAMAAPETA